MRLETFAKETPNSSESDRASGAAPARICSPRPPIGAFSQAGVPTVCCIDVSESHCRMPRGQPARSAFTAAPPLLLPTWPAPLPILVRCRFVTRPACVHPSQHSSSMAEQEEEWHPSEALATDHAARKLWLVKVMPLGRRGLHCWCRSMFVHAVPAII